MEIQFQHQPDTDLLNYTTMIPLPSKASKFKGRNKANGSCNNKYVGVRQRPSGRWVAEIKDTTQKIRMWLGTFQTAEEAARAYDEAACLLRGKNTRTNFVTPFVSHDSPLASRINSILNKRKNNSSAPKQQKHTPTSSTTSISTSSNDHNSCTTSSSPTPTNSCTSSTSSDDQKARDRISFHDAYKPDFSNFSDGNDDDQKARDRISFHDAYKPDFSNFSDGNDDDHQSSMSSWRRLQLQALQGGLEFNHHIFEFPKLEAGDYAAAVAEQDEFSEFERMKVERQISASLYAMNGVHEYMETVVCDPFWDLPPFSSLLYSD